jgi:transcriptional regulator with XRE-family HTH domain
VIHPRIKEEADAMVLDRKAFGVRLRRGRKRRGWKLKDMGMVLGHSWRTVAAWESGKYTPSAAVLYKLPFLLRLSLDHLIAWMPRGSHPRKVRNQTGLCRPRE